MRLNTQLDCLSALHGRQKIAQWKALARDDNWDGVVEQLLVEHYDPAYLKSIDRNFERAARCRRRTHRKRCDRRLQSCRAGAGGPKLLPYLLWPDFTSRPPLRFEPLACRQSCVAGLCAGS